MSDDRPAVFSVTRPLARVTLTYITRSGRWAATCADSEKILLGTNKARTLGRFIRAMPTDFPDTPTLIGMRSEEFGRRVLDDPTSFNVIVEEAELK